MRKMIFAGILLAGIMTLTGCFGAGNDNGLNTKPIYNYDYSQMKLVQFDEPYEGQPVADIETTLGNFRVVLYPEYAPNTVQNFIDRAKEGYYNGKPIYGIYEKSLFTTGAENEQKNSGVTSDGAPIPNEYSVNLWPFKGALCSYNGRVGYGDSRFFAIYDHELTDEQKQQLRDFTKEDGSKLFPDELCDAMIEKGGIADFMGGYTVFAQTIEGIDVIEKICSAEIDPNTYDPVEPISINKVTVGEYHAE
ncbi:MAG: peptidylprolyl isomerase [Ruminiclostridium sp.]|nr:peptidylprolyl isomerase [Ruminiclostridium sp.]